MSARSGGSFRWLPLLACGALFAGCGGGGGSGGGDDPAAPPTLEFSASPGVIFTGETSRLTWSSTHASKCTATGDWTGSRRVNGNETTPALLDYAAYSLNCTGRGGSIQRNVEVVVFPPTPAPQNVRAAPGDNSITVAWQSLAGSEYAGFKVTSNIYVSTTPNIDVDTFSEAPPNQVMRGLNRYMPVVFRGLTNGTPVYVVVTDVARNVESVPTQEISVTPAAIPPLVENIAALNDSGVAGCGDLDFRNLPCPVVSLPGQDAEHGRDAAATNGQLVKTGFGPAGFDLTKLDTNGDPLPDDAPSWPCVRDNVTGLIWEVPAEAGLTSAQNTYTWYQPDPLLNGGDPGQPDGGSCAGSRCDTEAFIDALNEAAHCGFQDWRLPTRREIFTLADFSRISPAIVASAFPNLPHVSFGYFWTSGSLSSPVLIGYSAWVMDLGTGQLLSKSKGLRAPGDYPGSILAVRAP